MVSLRKREMGCVLGQLTVLRVNGDGVVTFLNLRCLKHLYAFPFGR